MTVTGVPTPRWMRFLDWLEAHTPGGRWPWGGIWVWHGFGFHFASGYPTGFAVHFPLPRMLPGFVRSYQDQTLKRRDQRRETDLTCIWPVFPPGKPTAMRTRRIRARRQVP